MIFQMSNISEVLSCEFNHLTIVLFTILGKHKYGDTSRIGFIKIILWNWEKNILFSNFNKRILI